MVFGLADSGTGAHRMTALKKAVRVAGVILAATPAGLMIVGCCLVWWKIIAFVWSA